METRVFFGKLNIKNSPLRCDPNAFSVFLLEINTHGLYFHILW